jgi:[ribosomal protein S5]-alanine N-acetyltransferase
MLLVEPCSIHHLQTLLAGKENFFDRFGIAIAKDYELVTEWLNFSIKNLQEEKVLPRWGTHLLVLNEQRLLVGIGGYKGNPDRDGMVEIGYSIAPSYQNKGLATQAARILINRAFSTQEVKLVRAHTLPFENPSTSVLKKVDMVLVGEYEDKEDGIVWRWEIRQLNKKYNKIDREFAQKFARNWVQAWNDRDLDSILSHYSDDFEMASPFIASMTGESSGSLKGKEKIAQYWRKALEKIPDFQFEIIDVLLGVNSIVIYYKAVFGKLGSEIMLFDEDGKVIKAIAHYNNI